MCYAKPGPRCASAARKNLAAAQSIVDTLERKTNPKPSDYATAMTDLAKAQREYAITNEGIARLQKRVDDASTYEELERADQEYTSALEERQVRLDMLARSKGQQAVDRGETPDHQGLLVKPPASMKKKKPNPQRMQGQGKAQAQGEGQHNRSLPAGMKSGATGQRPTFDSRGNPAPPPFDAQTAISMSPHFHDQMKAKGFTKQQIRTALYNPMKITPVGRYPGQWRFCGSRDGGEDGGVAVVVAFDRAVPTAVTVYRDGVVTPMREDQKNDKHAQNSRRLRSIA